MQMDSWNEREINCMLKGGNKKLLDFFKKYNIHQRMKIDDKYNTPAAELYRGMYIFNLNLNSMFFRIDALVENRPPPTELPKREAPRVPPPKTDYAPEEEATHPGESFEDRYNRMTRESNERLAKKFGGSGHTVYILYYYLYFIENARYWLMSSS